ncbi:cell adhesion molecule Dscam2-like [Haemaphysalis longicornis]
MTIERVTAEDLGHYTCTVSNAAGQDSWTATLTTKAGTSESTRKQRCGRQTRDVDSKPPEIQPFFFSKNSALGQRASVGCLVIGGTAPFRFHWEQNGRAIVNSASKYAKTKSEDLATVIIEKVGAEDVGNYTCFVTNAFGTDSYTALLVVEGEPEVMPFAFSKMGKGMGKMMEKRSSVTCVVSSGQAPFHFTWFRDGMTLGSDKRTAIKTATDNILVMTIERLEAEDLGNYTCVVSNDFGTGSHTAALSVENSPQIQPFSFPPNLHLGLKASVACMAYSGTGPFEFLWKHDGKVVDGSATTKYVKIIADNIATLTIERVQTVDIGNYTCTVNSAAGKDSYTAELTTEGTVDTPVIMPYSFPKNVALGQKTIVTCVAQSGAGPLDFQWWHNGRAIVDTSSRYSKKLAERVSTMFIEKLSAEDLGNYTCVVSNSAGQDTFTAPLLVEDLPRIQPFSFPENVNLGDEASVTCVVTRGTKPLRVTWTQDGKVVPNSDRKFAKVLLDNINTLTIRSVTAEDVGNYSCTATNNFGSHTASATFTVEGPPEVQPFSFSRNVLPGQKAVANCAVVGGDGPFTFHWTQDGRKLQTSATKYVKAITDTIVALTIEEVGPEDVGNYTCTVANAAAEDSYTGALVVKGRPEIMPFSFSKNIALGQKATVTCVVSHGTGPFRIEWKHGDHRVVGDSRKHVQTVNENVGVLTIDSVTAEDMGNYTCDVVNEAGTAAYSSLLAVEGKRM